MNYRQVHYLIHTRKGSAEGQPCVAPGCSTPASVWAWQRTGPSDTGIHTGGRTVAFGLDPDDYAAMCHRHSRQIDRGGTLTHCPRGHERRAETTNAAGICSICRADDERERRRLAREDKSLADR